MRKAPLVRLLLLPAIACVVILEGVYAAHHVHQVPCDSNTPVCECGSEYEVCEFNFTVETIETFTRYRVNTDTGIRSTLAHIWYIDEDGAFRPMPGGGRECHDEDIAFDDPTCTEPISVDGYTFRYVIAVNDRIPGPTLIVYQNQLVKVNVLNRLFSDGITIHWHGMLQEKTNWMDGTGGITQCSIPPYHSFTYIFNATQYGTHWYHSHNGMQRTEGAYGALIVKQDAESSESAKEKISEMTGLPSFEDKPGEHTLLFADWFKTGALAEIFTKTRSGFLKYLNTDQAPTPDTDPLVRDQETPDGSAISYFPFWSGLINGKGRHESVDYARTRLSIFTVSPNNVYRFRFIGAQTFYSYRVSIDEHKMIVVATDGEWLEPVTVDYLIVFSGERYDVLVHANQTSKDDFMIRAETLEIDTSSTERYLRGDHLAEAILHYDRGQDLPTSDEYESISNNSEPVATRCTTESECLTLNCPSTKFPNSYNTDCMNIHQTKLLYPIMDDDERPDASEVTDDDRLFLNFNFEGSRSSSAVNGRHFIFPSTPFVMLNDSQLAEYKESEFCKDLDDSTACGSYDPGSKDCVCPHVRTVNGGRTIQMIITNVGFVDHFWYESHPVHLHGHRFHVIDVQHGEYADNGKRTGPAAGIDCGETSGCTNPKWENSDPYSSLGKISRTAPLKDTLVIPPGGYAVVYFRANNPGWWLMACHVLDHFFEGMGLTIYETGDVNPPPPELHRCGNFDFTISQYEDAIANTTGGSSSSAPIGIVINIGLIFALMMMVVLAVINI